MNSSRNKIKETNRAIVNKKIFNSANNRRKPLVACGKKKESNPVEQEATNGHMGIMQAYSFGNFTSGLNPNLL